MLIWRLTKYFANWKLLYSRISSLVNTIRKFSVSPKQHAIVDQNRQISRKNVANEGYCMQKKRHFFHVIAITAQKNLAFFLKLLETLIAPLIQTKEVNQVVKFEVMRFDICSAQWESRLESYYYEIQYNMTICAFYQRVINRFWMLKTVNDH